MAVFRVEKTKDFGKVLSVVIMILKNADLKACPHFNLAFSV
jgi:hypothetical protein